MILVLPDKVEIHDPQLRDYAIAASTFTISSPGTAGRYGSEKRVLFDGEALPIGLLPRFLSKCHRGGVYPEVVDLRPPLPPFIDVPRTFGDIALRGYQSEAVEGLLEHHVGVVKSSTGSGKSIMIGALLCVVSGNWLVMVHRQNLLDSLRNTFLRMGGDARDVGVIQAGKFAPGRITFAMSSTLAKHEKAPEFLATVHGIVLDECQTAGAGGTQAILRQAINADRRYGFSATPYDRSDGSGLLVEAQLGPQRVHVSTERLLEEEQVAQLDVFSVIYEHAASEAIRTPYGYSKAYKEAITGNPERDMVAIECIRRAEMPGFVFVKHKDHAFLMHEKIRQFTGLNAKVVWQKTTPSQRDALLKDLNSGRIDVIVATKVFYEGADVPYTASVVDLAGGSSVIEIIQKVGRGSRRPDGKNRCQVWIIQDEGWSAFSAQSRERVAAIRDEGHPVTVCRFDNGELVVVAQLNPKKRRQRANAAGVV